MIKLFGSDVDGTLTDSRVYYNENEISMAFSRIDGKGFQLLRESGIKTMMITSSTDLSIQRRAEHLKIDYILLGIENKAEKIQQVLNENGLEWRDFAYIGDDINDLEVLRLAGLSATPRNSWISMDNEFDYVSIREGGYGAVREFAEFVLSKRAGNF